MNLGFVLIFKPGQIKARKKATQTPAPKKGKTTLKSSMFYDGVVIKIILWRLQIYAARLVAFQ